MLKNTTILLACALLLGSSCASVNSGIESANKGTEAVGKTVGKASRLPTSATEGAADGYAGQEQNNPYNR